MGFIVGLKKEMTQINKKDGSVVPCTIVDVSEAVVLGIRSLEKDGYKAAIVGFGKKKKATKAEKGMYNKLKFVPRFVVEFRLGDDEDESKFEVGKSVDMGRFNVGDKVQVTGVTKGKGFQGVVKRWGFKGGPRTHGQSDRERAPGSIGGGTDPGRVFKGKKMPGRMGNKTKTILNLEIAHIDKEKKYICIKGGLPGARNSLLKIYKTK